MAAKHAYWRKPDATPNRSDDGRFAPTALLEEIVKATSVAKDGSIQVSNLGVLSLRRALYSSVVILDTEDAELNEEDSTDIIWDSLRDTLANHSTGITASRFLKAINDRAASHFRREIKSFLARTSLSINMFPSHPIESLECTIQCGKSYPISFENPQSFPTKGGGRFFDAHRQSQYLPIVVKSKGRTPNEAMERALSAVDFLRGVWNLYATYCQRHLSFGTPSPTAIGVIHGGPIRTIHNADGTSAFDGYWYDPDFVEERKIFSAKSPSWDELEIKRKHAFEAIEKTPIRRELQSLLIRYSRALDHINLDVAFLQLWSILEKITDSSSSKLNYDTTIKRAIWLYKDRKTAKQLLHYLRVTRNRFVHAAKSTSDREDACYTIKSFLDPHLNTLIHNDLEIESLSDYARILALPTDTNELRRLHARVTKLVAEREKGNGGSKEE